MSELPSDLRASVPRPLPRFAPSLLWPLVIEAVGIGASAWLVVRGEAFLARWLPEHARLAALLGAGFLQLVGLGIILWALRMRSLLRYGRPAVGEVVFSRRKDASQLHVRYQFLTPDGKKLERDYFMGEGNITTLGFTPAAGDIAYVVHARDPRRFYLWGFARGKRPNLVSYPDGAERPLNPASVSSTRLRAQPRP